MKNYIKKIIRKYYRQLRRRQKQIVRLRQIIRVLGFKGVIIKIVLFIYKKFVSTLRDIYIILWYCSLLLITSLKIIYGFVYIILEIVLPILYRILLRLSVIILIFVVILFSTESNKNFTLTIIVNGDSALTLSVILISSGIAITLDKMTEFKFLIRYYIAIAYLMAFIYMYAWVINQNRFYGIDEADFINIFHFVRHTETSPGFYLEALRALNEWGISWEHLSPSEKIKIYTRENFQSLQNLLDDIHKAHLSEIEKTEEIEEKNSDGESHSTVKKVGKVIFVIIGLIFILELSVAINDYNTRLAEDLLNRFRRAPI